MYMYIMALGGGGKRLPTSLKQPVFISQLMLGKHGFKTQVLCHGAIRLEINCLMLSEEYKRKNTKSGGNNCKLLRI